jgi:hypothetical protein
LDKWRRRVRATPSGTWLVITVLTFLLVASIGQSVTRWDQVTEDWPSAVGAALGMMLPLAALGWGVRWAVKAADRQRESTVRR